MGAKALKSCADQGNRIYTFVDPPISFKKNSNANFLRICTDHFANQN